MRVSFEFKWCCNVAAFTSLRRKSRNLTEITLEVELIDNYHLILDSAECVKYNSRRR